MDISPDVICNLPDIQGYTTIWVEVDLFTKRANFILCRILPSVLSRPHILYRSLDSHMIWIVALNLHQILEDPLLLNIHIHLSSSRHPESNGKTEAITQSFYSNSICTAVPLIKRTSMRCPCKIFL